MIFAENTEYDRPMKMRYQWYPYQIKLTGTLEEVDKLTACRILTCFSSSLDEGTKHIYVKPSRLLLRPLTMTSSFVQ